MAQLAFPYRIYSACDKATKVFVPRSHKERELNREVINVGYLSTCPCKLQYVGKTNRQLKIRMNEHKTAVKRGEPHSLVAMHFKEAKHKLSDLKFCGGGIEKKQINNLGGYTIAFWQWLLPLEIRTHWPYEIWLHGPQLPGYWSLQLPSFHLEVVAVGRPAVAVRPCHYPNLRRQKHLLKAWYTPDQNLWYYINIKTQNSFQ